MSRPQFTLRALLVAMLVVAAFFGGMALQSQLDVPVKGTGRDRAYLIPQTPIETMTLPDGSYWLRLEDE